MPLRRLTSPCLKENHKYTPYDLLVRGKDTQNYKKIEDGGDMLQVSGIFYRISNPFTKSAVLVKCVLVLLHHAAFDFLFWNAGRLAGGYHFPIRGQLLD